MEQLNSMFGRMKRGIWSAGTTGQPTEKQQRHSAGENENSDISDEEDGFVFIEETKPRTKLDSPDGGGGQRMQWSTTENVQDVGRGFAMFASCNLTPESPVTSTHTWGEALGTSDHSAICGVPFQLNPKLQAKDNLHNTLAQLDLKTSRFDWQKYSYDFEVDRSSLHELCSTRPGLWERF